MVHNISPRLTDIAQDLTRALLGRRIDESKLKRGWWCPSDDMIAAYTDGVVGKRTRSWVEFHLARCIRCRLVVADGIKAQRQSELPAAPVALVGQAIALVGTRSASRKWTWAPAGALAAVLLVAALVLTVRRPEQTIVQSAPALPAPVIAKTETAPILKTPAPEIVRGLSGADGQLNVLYPHVDSVIQGEPLQFRWRTIPHARSYEVRVVNTDGDLVWQTEAEKSPLPMPADIALKNGSYFVWITAFLENGRTAKSVPVRFQVKR
jgi:hypothetical protein